MSTASLALAVNRQVEPGPGTARFGLFMLGFIVAMAVVAGALPLQFSIVSVFLCAGPHNWVEARYFMSRLPARWGRLQFYFLFGFAGVALLTAGFAGLPSLLEWANADQEATLSGYALWNTGLALWIASLVHMRRRQNPRRDWMWVWPVCFLVIALAWYHPMLWDLGLVYLHPLVALWILDREIKRTRPAYRKLYHVCLLALPVCLVFLWWHLAAAPPLEGSDLLTVRLSTNDNDGNLTSTISRHAGSHLLDGVSAHCLVATHTFLEAVHYGVWLLAIPWLGRRSNLWNVPGMPLGRRSWTWARAMQIFLVFSAVLVLVLWLCFTMDYPLTRDVYFTLAMVHVLAEIPFLLRAL